MAVGQLTWMEERAGLNSKLVEFHKLNTTSRGILAFIGAAGNWTPLHIDWTSAINVAYRINVLPDVECNHKDPIAVWYFFHPTVVPPVDEKKL